LNLRLSTVGVTEVNMPVINGVRRAAPERRAATRHSDPAVPGDS
jgi:hypothetical protein